MNILNLEAGTADVTSNEIHVGDMSPEQLCKYLQQTLRRLKGESIHPEGYSVNYFQMEYSTTFKELTRVAHLLTECDPSLLSLSERKAFFISILKTEDSGCGQVIVNSWETVHCVGGITRGWSNFRHTLLSEQAVVTLDPLTQISITV